jgi:DMSO/TMAO reductase YedYZ molybdopterin-dependent catalytic subunit
MTVTAAAPQSTDGARSEPPSRVAPSMTIAAAKSAEAAPKSAEAAPKSAETARAEVTAPVASESAAPVASEAAAPEATENVAPAPKKPKKTARKTPRHERQRDLFNPMNFFAWGGNNGWRRF